MYEVSGQASVYIGWLVVFHPFDLGPKAKPGSLDTDVFSLLWLFLSLITPLGSV